MSREDVLKYFVQQADYMNERVADGIEKNRKGNFCLTVCDEAGNALPGAKVQLHQTNHEFRVGANLYAIDDIGDEARTKQYKQLFADCFNLGVVPFYWAFLEPEKGKPRFSIDSPHLFRRPATDLCLQFCDEYGIEPKAHCLQYDSYVPQWVQEITDLGEEREALRKRFKELAERYADKIRSWEVGNEYLFPPSARNTAHFTQNDTVEWDFRTAEEFFPKNQLIINEAGVNIWPGHNGNRSPYYMLLQRALQNGCRIDHIGLQYHVAETPELEEEWSRTMYAPEHIFKVLDCYADFNLPMSITEISIPCYDGSEENEAIQAEILKNLYSIWFSYPNMEAIVYWDTVDGLDWRDFKLGFLREDLTPKKAYTTIRDLFRKTWHTEAELTADEGGKAEVRAFYGEYDVTVTANGKTVTKTLQLSKNSEKEIGICL